MNRMFLAALFCMIQETNQNTLTNNPIRNTLLRRWNPNYCRERERESEMKQQNKLQAVNSTTFE